MSSNPYAPTLAKVEDAPDHRGAPPFFQVAPWKLVLMTFCTLGLYQLYWLYQQWRTIRDRDRSTIWPVPRAIFSVFFCYSLFKRVRDDGQARHLSGPPEVGPLATVWIISSLAWRLPDWLGLLGMVSWLAVVPIQAYANRINAQAAPHAPRNDRLTWANWIAVGFLVVFLVLIVLAELLPVGE